VNTSQDFVFRRIAWRLLPLLTLCLLFAFIDRSNVGFAAITMRADLNMSAAAYGLGAGIFFISYFFFEFPSNLILARVGARRWISRIMISWGLLSALTALSWNDTSFLVFRFLLGAGEAGFFPGILFFLMHWFSNKWRARMASFLLLAVPLSNAIGAPVSGMLLGLNGVGGLHGWQWLFIIEGIPTCVLGVVLWLRLPDRVEDARWLTTEQKTVARTVLDAEATARSTIAKVKLSAMFALPGVWLLGSVLFLNSMTNGTVNFWLPQIVKSGGFTNVQTGFIVSIPYTVGACVLVLWGMHSDRTGERRWHAALPLLVSALGVAIAASFDEVGFRVAGLTLAATGMFSVLGVIYALPGEFLLGMAAAGGVAVINSIGNLGNFVGPYAVGLLKDYTMGYGAGLSLDTVTLLIAATIVLVMLRKHGRLVAVMAPSDAEAAAE
jgi:ACS family tartrate transporter-like MFS transporter